MGLQRWSPRNIIRPVVGPRHTAGTLSAELPFGVAGPALAMDDVGDMRAALIDVGGTLWPNDWPEANATRDRYARLHAVVPTLDHDTAAALVDRLSEAHPPGVEQRTLPAIVDALHTLGLDELSIDVVLDVMCLPARGRVQFFPGAVDLLAALHARGVRIIVVSNVVWRSAEAHHRDFRELGAAEYVDAFVTSLDVGRRKPDPVFFDVALRAAGVPPTECAMIGDSAPNDIIPAHRLGMTTVGVAIETPPSALRSADHVVTSLHDVLSILLDDAP